MGTGRRQQGPVATRGVIVGSRMSYMYVRTGRGFLHNLTCVTVVYWGVCDTKCLECGRNRDSATRSEVAEAKST